MTPKQLSRRFEKLTKRRQQIIIRQHKLNRAMATNVDLIANLTREIDQLRLDITAASKP